MKTSNHHFTWALLCLAGLLATSSGVAEEKDSSALTALSSTTIGGHAGASVTATFGSPMDSAFLTGVIRDALAHGVIFGATGNEPPGGVAPYPAILLSPGVPVETAGPRMMPVDVYGPSGMVTPLASPVPEPSTITLFLGGVVGLLFAVKRKT